MKAPYKQVHKWAKNIGIKTEKYSKGYYWYDKSNSRHIAKNISQLIDDINKEVSPVGTQAKIDAYISSWQGFMAFELED
jgi:hypothetical protein